MGRAVLTPAASTSPTWKLWLRSQLVSRRARTTSIPSRARLAATTCMPPTRVAVMEDWMSASELEIEVMITVIATIASMKDWPRRSRQSRSIMLDFPRESVDVDMACHASELMSEGQGDGRRTRGRAVDVELAERRHVHEVHGVARGAALEARGAGRDVRRLAQFLARVVPAVVVGVVEEQVRRGRRRRETDAVARGDALLADAVRAADGRVLRFADVEIVDAAAADGHQPAGKGRGLHGTELADEDVGRQAHLGALLSAPEVRHHHPGDHADDRDGDEEFDQREPAFAKASGGESPARGRGARHTRP